MVSLVALGLAAGGCAAPMKTGQESYKAYGEQIEDTKIVAQIKSNFHKNSRIPSELIHMAIDRGIVLLSGFIRTHEEADLAILSAKSTPGVKHVINSLMVLSDPAYANIRANAEANSTRR